MSGWEIGYHVTKIDKGIYGEFCKIEEEIAEIKDAQYQSNSIMELVELSDLYGAIEAYVEKTYCFSMEDLKKMSDATKRAFKNGHRKNSDAD